MTALVSVVVPAWNVATLLPRCLDSLLAQTHRRLEIIVVDDGSTDGTAEVARGYHDRHPEVQLISQSHRGIGPARNAGLSVVTGEYLCFVDADDWVEPDYVAGLLALATSTGADIAIGNLWYHLGPFRLPHPFLPRARRLTGEQAARLSLNPVRLPSFAWYKLYRTRLFRDPPFPSVWYEDIATTTGILARAGTVAVSRHGYYHYCLRDDSVTGRFGVKNVFSLSAALDLLRRYLHHSGRWAEWGRRYQRLLRQSLALTAIQVIVQPNHIPLRTRLPLLARYARRLRRLADPPTDGHELRAVPIRSASPTTTLPRRPLTTTVRVAPPGDVPTPSTEGSR
ncbi:MAG: glycosyltransferase [Propionicimonas sp.]